MVFFNKALEEPDQNRTVENFGVERVNEHFEILSTTCTLVVLTRTKHCGFTCVFFLPAKMF